MGRNEGHQFSAAVIIAEQMDLTLSLIDHYFAAGFRTDQWKVAGSS